MPRPAKKVSNKPASNAAERLFQAAFGRKMTVAERKRFIVEKPATLKELAKRSEYVDFQDFLSQT